MAEAKWTKNAQWQFDIRTGQITDLGGKIVGYVAASRMDVDDVENGRGQAREIGELFAASPALANAAEALIYEVDQIYDVDDGRPNIDGDIMKQVQALRNALAQARSVPA